MEWFAMALTLGEAHRRGQPHKVLHLTSYDRLEEYLRAFAQGHFNLLILVGTGGLSRRCGISAARELKAAGMDWTEVLAAEAENQRARLAAELMASAAYSSTAARVRAFVEQGGGCRATFFNHRRKLGGGNGSGSGTG